MSSLAYAALWIFIFALPWQNVVVIPGVGTISRLMGIVAFGLAILAAVFAGGFRRWRSFHLWALLFVLWAGLGLYRGGVQSFTDYEPMISKATTFVQLFFVLWMVWELALTRRRQLGLLLAYLLGAYVAAADTILVYQHHVGNMRRFAAEGFDPNDLAMMLALALPMAWYLGLAYRQRKLQWLCRGYLPVGLMAIALTGSRGGLIASVVGLSIVPLMMARISPLRITAAISLLAGAGALGALYVPTVVVQRLETTRSELEEGGMNGRARIWKAGLQAFEQRPLIGYGTGGFGRAVLPILGSDRGAHNSFLAVLVEQGMLGFLLFAAIFVAVFRAVRRLPRMERRFGMVLLCTLCVAMLPLGWDNFKHVWFILGFLVVFAESATLRPESDVEQREFVVSSSARRPAWGWRQHRPTMPSR